MVLKLEYKDESASWDQKKLEYLPVMNSAEINHRTLGLLP